MPSAPGRYSAATACTFLRGTHAVRAALFHRGALSFVADRPVPRPGPHEALVRVLVAGICRTDLEILRGYGAFEGVPGHEFVGVVAGAEGGGSPLAGKRVVGEINVACGSCAYCARGLSTHCAHRNTIGIHGRDGVFSEFVTLPAGNLREVPDGLSDEQAVFAEPLAAAFRIPEQVDIEAGQEILVLGDGKVGILSSLVLRLRHASVTLVGKHEARLAVAKRLGIRAFLLGELSREARFDVVIEATGAPEGVQAALAFAAPRGTIVLKSTVAGFMSVNLSAAVINEITIVGSRCGPLDRALEALSRGEVDVRPLVTSRYPIEDILAAMEKARERDSLQVLVDFRGG